MSAQELARVEVMSRVAAGTLRLGSAAAILSVSYRQAKRIWRRYRDGGARALMHGHAGRRSNRGWSEQTRARVLALVREKYSGDGRTRFGPTLAAEHLASEDQLVVDHETLRRWMVGAGLWQRRRQRSPYRQRRARKDHFGELVQLDGSQHAWLEARGPSGCAMTLVDDATSRVLLRFAPQETTWAAADVLRAWIEAYGVPQALYTDWKNVYVRRPTDAERLADLAPLTQFGRMCAALQIAIIPASSPQAQRADRAAAWHAAGSADQETAARRHYDLRRGECLRRGRLSRRSQCAVRAPARLSGRFSSTPAAGARPRSRVCPRGDADAVQRLGGPLSESLPAARAHQQPHASSQHRARVRSA